MALYRFESHDGHHAVEPATLDLPDLAAAQREGARRVGTTLVLDAHHLRPHHDWHLDVTDKAGTLLFRFDVAITVAPAARAIG